ncbi:MAG: DUF5343 domain-containing protein [Candidatus Fermentibacteraceae bacterium]
MSVIPAIREPASIAPFFKALAQTTVPGKVDSNFMAGIGFRRQSDVRLLELLHYLGFMDSSFQPTEVWRKYFSAPDEEAKLSILGKAVAENYAEALCKGGNDGSSRLNGKAAMAYFKAETGASETETAYMVLTLQILSDLTRLPGPAPAPDTVPEPTGDSRVPSAERPVKITLNITLDPSADPDLAALLRRVLEKNLGA